MSFKQYSILGEEAVGGEVFFTYYAMLVKNLRGVVLVDPGDKDSMKRVKWLQSRFRYRNLGLPPRIYDEVVGSSASTRVFKRLYYPLDAVAGLPGVLEAGGLSRDFAEALVFSSMYISPLFIASEKYLAEASRITVSTINVCRELSANEWKLHLRIADYTILDSYGETVELALKYINSGEKRILGERAEIAMRDSRRYWRIKCDQGKSFLLYLDPLILARDNARVKELLSRDHAPGLAVIPAVNITLSSGKDT